MKNLLIIIIAAALIAPLFGCLMEPEKKPGHVYHVDCTDLDADSVTYTDSGMVTTFYSTCPVSGEPQPPHAP